MKAYSLFIALLFLVGSCKNASEQSEIIVKQLNQHWIDSIIHASDSSYVRNYKRTDFVTAHFYIHRKDSTVAQFMKDSAGTIRQIIVAKNQVRHFFAQYYPNGQLQAELPLDPFGQYNGLSTYYDSTGRIISTGAYLHGFKTGKWKSFNPEGKYLSTEEYNSNGQLIQQ